MKYLNRLLRSIVPIAQKLRQAERGNDTTFEFTVWVVPLVTMVFLIGVVVIYWSSRLPVRAAAVDCARAAIATLKESVGVNQGEEAGLQSLHKNNINAQNATVEVTTGGGWSRGDAVTCTVRVKIDLGNNQPRPAPGSFTFLDLLLSPTSSIGSDGIEIVEAVTMHIEPLKSNWKN